MDFMDQKVKVVSGYYKEAMGVVTGSTVDGYWLVRPESNNGFWAKANELEVVHDHDSAAIQ